jgi:putative transcriptional regulator
VKKEEIRFFAGYSGWEPQQLDDELKGKTWLVSQGKKDFAFSQHPEELWGQVLRTMGSHMQSWPTSPKIPV